LRADPRAYVLTRCPWRKTVEVGPEARRKIV
jgi:hypothetical protein